MTDKTPTTRRRFLGGGGVLKTKSVTAARADNAKNLPPNVASWTRQLGEGAGVRGYGAPSKYEKDVARRTVPWLTATPESSVSFTPLHQLDGIITPNGLCFERHHGGIAEIDPADYRLILHGLVEKPLVFTLDELKRLPRVNKIYFLECAANSGMEWHGALRGIHGRLTEGLAGAGRIKAERKMDHGRGRGCGRDESVDSNQQGARRLHRGLPHERRDVATRAGLSRASRCAGLGRQRLGQMAAPPQGRRSAMVHARGNLEIHRPSGKRQGAKIYLRDGREIRHHIAVAADAGESKRVQRHFGFGLVRTRQDQAGRYFSRRWPKLADGASRWTRVGQGVRALLLRIRLEWRRAAAPVARH